MHRERTWKPGWHGWIIVGLLFAPGGKAQLKIIPATLPAGTVSAAYSQALTAGCSGVCAWSSTGTLPPGLSLGTVTGVISGTPTAAGSYHFTVSVLDAKLQTGSQDYTLVINSPPVVSTASPLPGGKVGTAYSQTLAAAGGVSPYTWSVAAGSLPPGIVLNSSTGVLSGTPTAASTFTFTVQVADTNSATATKSLSVTIAAGTATLAITTTSPLPGGTAGSVYSVPIAVAGGTSPYTWAVVSGALPPGLSLNSVNGSLSGTPSSAGTFNFTVQVTDASRATASTAFTLTIASSSPKLTITTTSPLPNGTVGAAYSQTLTASGGTPPYTWSVTSGALPGGLALNAGTGAISGTPQTAGAFPFTIRVTDTTSAVADQPLQITVGTPSAGPLSFSGVPDTSGSGQQLTIALQLSSASSQAISGQIALSFQPNAVAPVDDPAIQFSTGSRTVSFNIPAGQTKAVFPTSSLGLQTGTVAGTITLAVTSNLAGSNFSKTIVLPRTAPGIQSATVTTNSSGFQLLVTGFSNTRELAGATFHFTAASGQVLQTSDLTLNLATQASQWYTGSTSAQFGGQFLLMIPFTVSQGTAGGLSSVTVELQNGQSPSSPATAKF